MKFSILFPGQGTQYVGMGRSFYDRFPLARELFQKADDILHTSLSKLIFNGPESTLTETKNSQVAIFVVGYAIFRVLKHHYGLKDPMNGAGLSLGEYTALTALGYLDFEEALPLVQRRGFLMHKACEKTKGGMLALLGTSDEEAKAFVQSLNLPNDLWCANFNTPGQVVLSGTTKGIELAEHAAKEQRKRVIPLKVHGAFHSGLMKYAEQGLREALQETSFHEQTTHIAMNTTGQFLPSIDQVRNILTKQITSSVFWYQCVQTCRSESPSFFLEIGPGKTLSSMMKRAPLGIPIISVDSIDDLEVLEKTLSMN